MTMTNKELIELLQTFDLEAKVMLEKVYIGVDELETHHDWAKPANFTCDLNVHPVLRDGVWVGQKRIFIGWDK